MPAAYCHTAVAIGSCQVFRSLFQFVTHFYPDASRFNIENTYQHIYISKKHNQQNQKQKQVNKKQKQKNKTKKEKGFFKENFERGTLK